MNKGPSRGTKKQQARELISQLERHPRTVFQQMIMGKTMLKELERGLPYLVPFADNTYHGMLSILDWDHRLPSQNAILRIYAYYSEESYAAGKKALARRNAQIQERDKFPEFDVPDFADLNAEEAYEASVEASGKVRQVQLASEWRRDIAVQKTIIVLDTVRKSNEFRKINAMGNRPDYLGDLEARSWTPPCEGEYHDWTIDVWYLTEYNGVVGKGMSFLVDVDLRIVVRVREFMIRVQ